MKHHFCFVPHARESSLSISRAKLIMASYFFVDFVYTQNKIHVNTFFNVNRARVAELDAHRGLTRSVQVQIPVAAKILSY
jgi:hypothetical protein